MKETRKKIGYPKESLSLHVKDLHSLKTILEEGMMEIENKIIATIDIEGVPKTEIKPEFLLSI